MSCCAAAGHVVEAYGAGPHELNFVFEVAVTDTEPVSQEKNPKFGWPPLDQLADADVRPGALKNALATTGDTRTPLWHEWNR